MTVETPQPRDRVRWKRTSVIEGVVEETGADGIVVRDGDGYKHLCQVEDATVEVLERADDPSKDPIGTVRKGDKSSPVVRCRVTSSDVHPWKSVMYTVSYSHDEVVGWPVTGAVPGTPAAEAAAQEKAEQIADLREKLQRVEVKANACRVEESARPSVSLPNEPHGIPLGIRQQAAELLISGNKRGAAGVVGAAMGVSEAEALAYVESMVEYETYLNHHGRTEVDPTEADRMRAMGFDKQPEVKISDEDRALIRSVLLERQGEYFDLSNLYTEPLAGVVADIVYAAIVQDRKRGDR